MNAIIKKVFSAFMLLILPGILFAQNKPQMADAMRSNGKIYVVVAVLVIIFIGILFLLISIDRKIRKLENEVE